MSTLVQPLSAERLATIRALHAALLHDPVRGDVYRARTMIGELLCELDRIFNVAPCQAFDAHRNDGTRCNIPRSAHDARHPYIPPRWLTSLAHDAFGDAAG